MNHPEQPVVPFQLPRYDTFPRLEKADCSPGIKVAGQQQYLMDLGDD